MVNKSPTVTRVYLPPDANTLLCVADHCLRSLNYVNVIVADKQPHLLPAEVAALALANPAKLYDLLMRSAAATLRDVAAHPRRLGAVVGVLMVLHTWGQNLHHPHVHGVVTGGGLSCDRAGNIEPTPRWRACRPGFFLPVRVLSRVFRGKFLAGVRSLGDAGQLRWPGCLAARPDAGWAV